MLIKSSSTLHKTKWRIFPLLSALFALILSIPPVFADNLVVLSRSSDSYQKVADSIQVNISSHTKVVTLQDLEDNNFNTEGFEHIVAVGSRAADRLYNRITASQKLYASFLPRLTYQALLARKKDHTRIQNGTITAVFLDQPYTRQLRLARIIAPNANTVATALGPNSKNDLPLLEAAAQQQQFELSSTVLQESDNPIHKLQPLIRNADLFLSLPDKSVFNRTTAKWILYISFRQRIPLIGFSQKYVEAGALTAVYSTPEQIGKQTAEIIQQAITSTSLPEAQYPKYFSVITNQKAANSLNIKLPSEDALTQQLMEMER
ncbi:ABC transporter substrate-binding protein [Neptuniibacter sp. QD34_54]|uniref:ABC transporter substrate-binding protein n=1 Tax=Neptuniibacter sp. QD34_54 TaxID=3398208 RepID=UPI0039F48BCD